MCLSHLWARPTRGAQPLPPSHRRSPAPQPFDARRTSYTLAADNVANAILAPTRRRLVAALARHAGDGGVRALPPAYYKEADSPPAIPPAGPPESNDPLDVVCE